MIRPIDNNYISKHRYYELKHFCYQYHEWEKAKTQIKIFPGGDFSENFSDPTGEAAVQLAQLDHKIELVDRCLQEVAPEIYIWLKMCVVDGKSYNVLQSYGVPCGKEYFYLRYRAFFSRLNQLLKW